MSPFDVLVIFLAGALCVVWLRQFVKLMLLSDTDFPGKYDKCLWTAVFVLLSIIAPFAFMFWKSAYEHRRYRF